MISRKRRPTVRIRAPHWREARDPRTGKLLFRYDPARRVVEIKHRHQRVVEVPLTELEK